LVAAGCSDSSSSTGTSGDYPTLLTVDPSLFRGTVTCGAPGLERYVATVTDISVDLEKPVTSSGPVPCQSALSFGEPIVGYYHYYTAVIDGYDRADIEPAVAGKREMVDNASKAPVAPAWTTTCGQWPLTDAPDAGTDAAVDDMDAALAEDAPSAFLTPYMQLRLPTRALGKLEVIFHGCLPMVASATPDASAPDASDPIPTKTSSSDEPGVGSLAPPLVRTGADRHDVDGGGPSR
jgi:hypothetical protein